MAIDDEHGEPLGADIVREMHQSRLDAARSQYEAGINRLWAGCGGGLIGVVSVLRHPNDLFFWLCVVSFGFGVLFLAAGVVLSLITARTAIRHLEDIHGILEMKIKYATRMTDQAGLSLAHPQTWTGFVAAGLFIAGVIFAGVLVGRQ